MIGCGRGAFDNRQSSLRPNTEPIAVSHRITATPCATLETVLFSLSTCRSIELLRPHYPIPSALSVPPSACLKRVHT